MIELLLQLVILFTVIFDPLASFVIFFAATNKMSLVERRKTADLAAIVAGSISAAVLLLGNQLLHLFNTNIQEFQVAGGIVLGILGIKMVLGQSFVNLEQMKESSGWALASIIGTPLLTGPAAITAIIISTADYGVLLTGLALAIVLLFTWLLLYHAAWANKYLGKTTIQVISTILGLITLAWGVKFVLQGLQAVV